MGRSSVAASARTTMTSCWRESAPSSYPRTPTAGISTCASTARSCTRASDSAWSARWRGSAASRTSARRSRFPAPCTSCGRRSARLHLVPQPVQVRQTGASEIEPALLGEPFDGLEAARELVVRALERGAWVDGELAGKVHDREQQIAQLVTQPGGVVLLEGLIEFERFFHEIRAQRVARLDAVPGAARAQVAHQRERAGEGGVTRHRVSEAAGVAGNLAGGLSYARL